MSGNGVFSLIGLRAVYAREHVAGVVFEGKASNSFLFGLPRHRISRKRVGRMEKEVLHGHRDMQHRKNDAKTTDSTSRAVGPLSKGCRLQRDSDTKPVAALVGLTFAPRKDITEAAMSALVSASWADHCRRYPGFPAPTSIRICPLSRLPGEMSWKGIRQTTSWRFRLRFPLLIW